MKSLISLSLPRFRKNGGGSHNDPLPPPGISFQHAEIFLRCPPIVSGTLVGIGKDGSKEILISEDFPAPKVDLNRLIRHPVGQKERSNEIVAYYLRRLHLEDFLPRL